MGETQCQRFQLSIKASLKIDFQGSRVTSDGGLILVRELDEHLGLGEPIAQYLTDQRGTNTRSSGTRELTRATDGDWVLVLDDARRKLPPPGQR